jgi:hypothetical protein
MEDENVRHLLQVKQQVKRRRNMNRYVTFVLRSFCFILIVYCLNGIICCILQELHQTTNVNTLHAYFGNANYKHTEVNDDTVAIDDAFDATNMVDAQQVWLISIFLLTCQMLFLFASF